jgi:PilZ domain
MTGMKDRRKRPRVSLNGEIQGRIHTVAAAPVLNLSEDGALLEVACSLRVGTFYMLRLQLARDAELLVRSRIVRSAVHGFEIKAGGESLVKYRTAVEFVDITGPQKKALQKYLTGLGGEFDTEFDEDLDE